MVKLLLKIFLILFMFSNLMIMTEANHNLMNNKRHYKFPSMMVKDDWINEKGDATSLRGILIEKIWNGWKVIEDKYGRNCQYVSPELSYAELQNILNFNDEDVTYNNEAKASEPQASIKTEWLTCNITFKDKIYDGKDNAVKLTAVVIDNEVQKKADEHAEYDKNKGWIAKIIEFFSGGDIH